MFFRLHTCRLRFLSFTTAFVLFILFVYFRINLLLWRDSPPVEDNLPYARKLDIPYKDTEQNSSAKCSTNVFRNYYASRNYFPGEGEWVSNRGFDATESNSILVANRSQQPAHTLRYVSKMCTFRYGSAANRLPPETLRRCLRRHSISSIATMGDSNGAHHFDAILRILNETGTGTDGKDSGGGGGRCHLQAIEHVDHTLLMPDIDYYVRYDRQLLPILHATYRHCSSCVSRLYRCRADDAIVNDGRAEAINQTEADNGRTVDMEHLSMVSVLDSSLKIDVPHNHFAVNLQYRADTYQEFLLKYYLRGRYPDLLIIFPPFNHDKKSQTTASLALRMKYFVELLDLYLPATTRVIWVPSFREFESRKPPVWANRRMHGMLGTQKIDLFNRKLFQILRHKLTDMSDDVGGIPRTMAFFDQVKVSETREDWSIDGVHMNDHWYREISSYLLQMFCSDAID